MKRQVNSPMGSPYVTQTLRAKTKRVVGAAAPVPAGVGAKAAAATRGGKRPGMPVPRPRDTETGAAAAGTSSRRSMEERWSQEMDDNLREAVLRHGADWTRVVSHLMEYNVSAAACSQRWSVIQDVAVKGPWSAEEDDLLRRLVEQHGSKKWSQIALEFPGRSGKQCRERWLNHLDTRVKKSSWGEEEDQVLCEAQRRLGNKWSEISKLLPGRAENAVKNRFNSLMTRRATGGGMRGGNGGSSDGAYPSSSRRGASGRSGGGDACVGKGRAGSPPPFIAAVLEGGKLAAGPRAAKDGAAGERSRIWAALEAQRGGRPLPPEAGSGEPVGEASAGGGGGGGSGVPPRGVRRRRRRYSEEFDDVEDTEEEEDECLSDDIMGDDSDDYGAARRRRAAAAAAASRNAAASSNSASRGSSAATDGTSRSGARSSALLRRGPGGTAGAAVASASGPATLDTSSSTSTSPPLAGRAAGGGGSGGMGGGKELRYMPTAAGGSVAAMAAGAEATEEAGEEILRGAKELSSVDIAAWWQAGLQPSEEDLARALDGASAANGYTTFADGRHLYADASPLGPTFSSPAGDAALFSSGDWRSVPLPPADSFHNHNGGGGRGSSGSSIFPPPPQPSHSAAAVPQRPYLPSGSYPLDDNIIPTPLDISTQAGDIAFDVLAGGGSVGSSATRAGAYDGFTGGLRSLDLPQLSPNPLSSATLGGLVGTGGMASSSHRLAASLGASGGASGHRGARAMHERAAAGAAAAGAAAADAAAAVRNAYVGSRMAPPAAAAAGSIGGSNGSRHREVDPRQVAQLQEALGSLDLNKSTYWANTAMSVGSAMGAGRQAFDVHPSVMAGGGGAPPSIVVRPLGDSSTFGPGSAYYGNYSGRGGGPTSSGWGSSGGGLASNGWGGGGAMMMSPGGGMMSPLAIQLSAISRESDPATRAARRAQAIERYMMNGN